ncbi:MAG: UDP-3-O-(3-hydroxymyristoyl)glucosamine N-acyltransferase [Acidobacteriota bacterium]|nr:UDP-3-O-(3-hydroxymyristoyl)glucosamine N-acyltransferase [Acidobacteriota bacterium]
MIRVTTGELAERLGLPLRGDGTRAITGAAVLEEAAADQIAFAGSAKFFDAALKSRAGCIVAPAEYAGAGGQTVIESPQPRAHFAMALSILYPPAVEPGIHRTAVVDESAMIGNGASIGAGCVVGRDVRIGAGTVLHPRVTLYERVTVGARCVIHSGAVIGADGFGFEMTDGRYRKVPQVGTVEIGDDVEIGANTCIDRATLGATAIGEGTKLDNLVHIAHNCRIGRHVAIAAQTGLAGGVTIGDYAVVGGQVGVGDKARIEARAVVGSGAGILTSKVVRAGEPVWGTPARPLRQYLAQLATLSRITKRKGH